MKTILKIQNNFIDAIYNKDNNNIFSSIKNSKIPKKDLIDVYRNNLYDNLINSMEITYPKIHSFFSNKKFESLCKEFIQNNRSYSGNLDDYGEDFSDFLSKKNNKFLGDLAKLEWLRQKSYLAEDIEPIDLMELQKLDPEKLFNIKFLLSPSCFLLNSYYNLFSQKRPKIRKNLAYFVIYRQNFDIKSEKISKKEFIFLNSIKNDFTLYQIYEKYDINIELCLKKYLENGILCKYLGKNLITDLTQN